MASKTIKVDYLARVEGEGALYIRIDDNKVEDVKLKIFEPPRFFEALLRGRNYLEAPDITARICGICPIAYMSSSSYAMERICGIELEGQIRELRRLIYCAEYIESHALHAFMLHLPDFLGYESAIHMAKDHPDLVKTALRLKKLGNNLLALIGGRETHPINYRVGGFYKSPAKADLQSMRDEIDWARGALVDVLGVMKDLNFPDFEQDYEFVCMSHPDEYPFCEGRLVSNKGIDIDIEDFEEVFEERHVEHSTSLHAAIKERGNYFVGPLARYSNEFEKLSDNSREVAQRAGLGPVCRNPFKSLLVRTVETFYSCEEAIRIIEQYEPPDPPYIDAPPRAGTAAGCSEAPRGICWHRYSISDNGTILEARIVPPTSQNQSTIENDLYWYVAQNIDADDDKLQWECEQAIRNYDPCISCSCHFLNLSVDRT